MAWYDDLSRTTHVATYSSERAMRTDMENAARFGFLAQSTSRSEKQWLVTYHRTEATHARLRLEHAVEQVRLQSDLVASAQDRVAAAEHAVTSSFRAARSDISDPTNLERQLLNAIKALIKARDVAIGHRNDILGVYNQLVATRDSATTVHVTVPGADLDASAQTAVVHTGIQADRQRIQRERALLELQETVVKLVGEWSTAVGDWWRAQKRLANSDSAPKTQSTPMHEAGDASASIDKPGSQEGKRAKRQAQLVAAEQKLQGHEEALLQRLKERDTLIAALIGSA